MAKLKYPLKLLKRSSIHPWNKQGYQLIKLITFHSEQANTGFSCNSV